MHRRAPAQFVISIDLEMSWGAIHHGRPHDDGLYRQERAIVGELLGAFDHYGISATWAVVGHLFLRECAPTSGRNHPEIRRPEYPWHPADWYDLDPGGSFESDPTWYGPDLVEAIQSCSTPQEIGSHAFSHLIAGEDGCSAEAFRADLAACRTVAEGAGVDLSSFVFPRNSIGHLDELVAAGFTAYRGPTPDRFPGVSGWRRSLAAGVDRVRPSSSAAMAATQHGPLTDVPQTYFFQPNSANAQRYGTRFWSWLVVRRLRHAVRTGSLFHLWFHSHDLARHRERGRVAMTKLLSEARKHIDAGRLENLTMRQVADRMRRSHDQAA